MIYPQPQSHQTFTFGNVVIDSNFDSGNCCGAEKSSNNLYKIWIGTDHKKNNYRTWFHFSAEGFSKGTAINFRIMNMQNQSRLLNQGLVPVYRVASSDQWNRISDKVNTSNIEYNQGWIQWNFKHTWTTDEKVYLAFFYPWSNVDNDNFLKQMQEKVAANPEIYFHRTNIINSLEGRPVQFITISSNKGRNKNKQELINDDHLFKNGKKPSLFAGDKKSIVIGARVHPGQVPASHVMTGIIEQLTEDNNKAKALRDNFIFYIFPIFNPDGVARGHYRVDTNGINLNRCYLNPSPKSHPSIYAVKQIIIHLHRQGSYFAFLDLHAHAARKGTFIYGNYTNQLMKQIDTCIFPKILSMNSIDFEYEGSNFTQKNMYCKDKGDHMSKQGSGRVAIFKATKNAYCWTLECNYNISKINNILEPSNIEGKKINKVDQNNLDQKIIIDYRYPPQKQATQFFTIATYRKLGKEICESFLDLIQKNPESRIDNPDNHFKSVQNLKMNLAVALLKMQPNRFESNFKRIYNGLNNKQSKDIYDRSLKALYYYVVKNAKIDNINGFLKDGDTNCINFPSPKKPKSLPSHSKTVTKYSSLLQRNYVNKIKKRDSFLNSESISPEKDYGQIDSPRKSQNYFPSSSSIESDQPIMKVSTVEMVQDLLLDKLRVYQRQKSCHKVSVKFQQFKLMDINGLTKISKIDRKQSSDKNDGKQGAKTTPIRFKIQQLPSLNKRSSMNFTKYYQQTPRLNRKHLSAKQQQQTNQFNS